MPTDRLPMTVRGKALLEAELKRLVHEERPAVIKAIEDARSHGDVNENAEYDAAKENQSMIEGRIGEIQFKLSMAEVIDPTQIKSETVVFGATVSLIDLESEDKSTYQIVGLDEADVKKGLISILSPMARAMIGKRKGETVVVQSPKGDREYEILSFDFK